MSISGLGSPCDSCLTLSTLFQQQQHHFNQKYLLNYINHRINDDVELVLLYNHTEIQIKLSSISSLINSYTNITISQLTINHLFLYLYYHRFTIFHKDVLINQIKLIQLGKPFQFQLNMKNYPTLINDLKIYQFPKMMLFINDDSLNSNFKYFNVESYLKRQETFIDKSTGNVTYVDLLVSKLKRRPSDSASINSKLIKRSKRLKLVRFLKRIVV